ncbi:hypothetical protein CISIN_1g020305mg [Citrus sinensis]|uniref:ARID domain-containing protein n=1 Tax=Citrus sinensis TaxID=2711 RepID=A0A067GZ34_CITSI|nr:hypothetical protein CISIN_1g020305mg [Citrus sinensis]
MSQSSAAKTKGRSVVEDKLYPAPLSSHEDVSKDPIVFWDTLRRFHFIMGTKFMIPVIGGKELDLHVLYVEATTRGGYEKVVAEKKWREVGAVFKFSPTTTSASFVLRKHYLTLLYHYEQVHFFKMQGPPCVPSGKFEFLLVQQYLRVTCSEFFVFYHQILTRLCLLLFGLFVGLILFITLQQLHFLFTALRAGLAWLLWNIPRKGLMIIRIHILKVRF